MPYDDRGGAPKKRPTEAISGFALFGLVLGLVTSNGGPVWLGILLGFIAAFGPLVVSTTVDALRRR